MGHQLTCPCGERIIGRDDVFIAKVNAHLNDQHDGRTYPDDMIMMMAMEYSDDKIPEDEPPGGA